MLDVLRNEVTTGAVARGRERVLTAEELWQNAALVASRLPAPSPGSMVTFAFGHDRAAFAAALLGSWLAGHGVALPESDRRASVLPVMLRPEHAEFLHDCGVRRGIDVSELLAAERTAAITVPPLLPPDPDRIVLETHTPGGDGRIGIERFTASELTAAIERAIDDLELARGEVAVHGFAPMFLPAVLVGLLAPLRLHGGFGLDHPKSVAELADAAAAAEAAILLCSAPQLRGLAELPAGRLGGLSAVLTDGPPPDRPAELVRDRHDVRVGAALGDEVDALATCTERLFAIDGVVDAGVGIAPPDAPAEAFVAIVGPDSVLLSARAAAAAVFEEHVELVLRTVEAVPRDPNGRVDFGDLCARLGRGRDGARVTRELSWRSELEDGGDEQRYRTQLPRRYAFFEGHFTTYAVLAGGVQLQELVLPCIRAARPAIGPLERLDGVKFLARIAPGDELVVRLSGLSEGRRVQFEIWCGDTRCTSGKLHFAAAAEGGDSKE